MKTSELFRQIEELTPKLDGWCIPEKACDFAATVVAMRPAISVEIGVWGGRGTIAMALAHRFVGTGKVIAIDPWSAPASVEGQSGANQEWWADQNRHDLVYQRFLANVDNLALESWIEVQKARSDQVSVPLGIGVLVVDGNHGPQAIADVKRFAPNVIRGGVVYLDDINWDGGSVSKAQNWLMDVGFRALYLRDQGAFFQRSN